MKNEHLASKVREWLTQGISGEHPYPAAIEQARASGIADIHLDVLLTGTSIQNYVWEWNQAIAAFNVMIDLLGREQNIIAQMIVYLHPFNDMLLKPHLVELLNHLRPDPPNFYVLRRDWWTIADEELHRYPLGNSVFGVERDKAILCYEVSRPTSAANDLEEFYPTLNAYWIPKPG